MTADNLFLDESQVAQPMQPHLSILIPCRGSMSATSSITIMGACLMAQMEFYRRHGLGALVSFWALPRAHVHIARWHLLRAALDGRATEILWFDDDAVPPPDIYSKLARHGKDMVVPWFTTRTDPPVCTSKSGALVKCEVDGKPALKVVVHPELDAPGPDGLVRLITSGLHCCLMTGESANAVVEFNGGNSPFTMVSEGKQATMGEDSMFFQLAAHAGLELWLDPSVKVGHVGENVYE